MLPQPKHLLIIRHQFVEDLQDSVGKVPPSDVVVLLGDFNARVG